MKDWNIGINSEGDDARMDDLKRRASAGADWADEQFALALTDLLMTSLKRSDESAKKEVDENTVYFAVAHRLLEFIDVSLDSAVKTFVKENPKQAGNVDTLKIRVVAALVKRIAEGKEELRKL